MRSGGETLYEAKKESRRAFSEDVAADATFAMQQVVASGSGAGAQLAGRPAAGKTGTTSGNKDLWFAGFTPQLSTAVWFGYGDNRKVTIRGVNEATGGAVSAGVFKLYMDRALEGEPAEEFPPRADVGDEVVVPVAPPAPDLPAAGHDTGAAADAHPQQHAEPHAVADAHPDAGADPHAHAHADLVPAHVGLADALPDEDQGERRRRRTAAAGTAAGTAAAAGAVEHDPRAMTADR